MARRYVAIVLRRALAVLRCPLCTSALQLVEDDGADPAGEVWTGALLRSRGDRFPVVGGIPRLLPEHVNAGDGGGKRAGEPKAGAPDVAMERTRESFSREWGKQRVADRTWYTD